MDDGEIARWCREYKYERTQFLKGKRDEFFFEYLNRYQSQVEELGREKYAFEQKVKKL